MQQSCSSSWFSWLHILRQSGEWEGNRTGCWDESRFVKSESVTSQLCPTHWDAMDCTPRRLCPWHSPSRQEHWSGSSCPSPGRLPNQSEPPGTPESTFNFCLRKCFTLSSEMNLKICLEMNCQTALVLTVPRLIAFFLSWAHLKMESCLEIASKKFFNTFHSQNASSESQVSFAAWIQKLWSLRWPPIKRASQTLSHEQSMDTPLFNFLKTCTPQKW